MRFLLVIALLVVVIARPSESIPNYRDADPTSPCYQQPDGYVNNPASCRAFWSCQGGIATPVNCPVGFHFNVETQLCDLPKNFPCVDGEDPPATTPGTTASPTPTSIETSTQPTSSTTANDDPDRSICYGVPDGHFINNPISCAAYYVCSFGEAHESSCREGLNFNEAAQLCDNPLNYPCEDDTSSATPTDATVATTVATTVDTTVATTPPPATTQEPDRPFQCPPSGIISYPMPDTCTTFRFCFAGVLLIRSCAEGLHFDEVNRRCDFAENLNCVRGLCPLENDANNIVTHPSRNDCGQFYVCYNGELQQFQCAPGLWWNQNRGHCDRPSNVVCEIERPETTTVAPLEIKCPSEDTPGPHFVPHPKDCTKFFICSMGIPHLRMCPQDLLFDPILQTCNKPDRVVCFEEF